MDDGSDGSEDRLADRLPCEGDLRFEGVAMSVMVRRGEATATTRCSELRPGVSNINEHSDAVYFLDAALPIGDSWRIFAPAGMSTKRGEAHTYVPDRSAGVE